ncbi:hypothetical protein PSPO01_07959 [Paraphaeosphaeria sporulosa]
MSTTNVVGNDSSVGDTSTVIIGSVFAVLALITGLPGAILAVKKLRGRSCIKHGTHISILSVCQRAYESIY